MEDNKWYNDEELLKQFDEETRKYESGEDKGFTIIEMNEKLEVIRNKVRENKFKSKKN